MILPCIVLSQFFLRDPTKELLVSSLPHSFLSSTCSTTLPFITTLVFVWILVHYFFFCFTITSTKMCCTLNRDGFGNKGEGNMKKKWRCIFMIFFSCRRIHFFPYFFLVFFKKAHFCLVRLGRVASNFLQIFFPR